MQISQKMYFTMLLKMQRINTHHLLKQHIHTLLILRLHFVLQHSVPLHNLAQQQIQPFLLPTHLQTYPGIYLTLDFNDVCEAKSESLVYYPRTQAPSNGSVAITAECAVNVHTIYQYFNSQCELCIQWQLVWTDSSV